MFFFLCRTSEPEEHELWGAQNNKPVKFNGTSCLTEHYTECHSIHMNAKKICEWTTLHGWNNVIDGISWMNFISSKDLMNFHE